MKNLLGDVEASVPYSLADSALLGMVRHEDHGTNSSAAARTWVLRWLAYGS